MNSNPDLLPKKRKSIEKALSRGKSVQAIAGAHQVSVDQVRRIQAAMKDEGK